MGSPSRTERLTKAGARMPPDFLRLSAHSTCRRSIRSGRLAAGDRIPVGLEGAMVRPRVRIPWHTPSTSSMTASSIDVTAVVVVWSRVNGTRSACSPNLLSQLHGGVNGLQAPVNTLETYSALIRLGLSMTATAHRQP